MLRFCFTNTQLCGGASVYMEIFYILCSIWKYKLYCVWSFLIVVVILLCVVISCSTIVAIYFRLSNENYLWQWTSFWAPFSTSFTIFGYCIFFYMTKLTHESFLQAIYFFSSSLLLSCIVGVICGFIGFGSSAFFVRIIYKNLKMD